ncbi:MAG: hypothetical protein C0492_09955 [Verminephrobacter sp.]|nr:hypothetical protein [Verminephrobacter sp.]
MSPESLALLSAGIFVVAVLYSSVGHAGASGYIAVMSLLAIAPAVIKPTALSLNILVALIATWHFFRAGHLSWSLFWPFGVLAVPCAFLGGYLQLPSDIFKVIVGLVLLYSAARFFMAPATEGPVTRPPLLPALASGAVIGLLSGLTGTGGGIFLTPLLLFMGWASAKPAAGVSALFILLNSVAGLLGAFSSTKNLPDFILPLLLAAALGGVIGSYFGSRRFAPVAIKRLLAAVLLIAGAKLILT